MGLDSLGFLNQRPAMAVPKGESRLQSKGKRAKDDVRAEDRWKMAVRAHDDMTCRWCRRNVRVTLELVADRAECHHVNGRDVRAIRWDPRNGILLCCSCHERVTGRVNERFVIVSNHAFTVDGVSYINGQKPVNFRRVA